MIETFTCDVNIQRGLSGFNEINIMEVHPIEIDPSVSFYNKKSRVGTSIFHELAILEQQVSLQEH